MYIRVSLYLTLACGNGCLSWLRCQVLALGIVVLVDFLLMCILGFKFVHTE